MAAYQEITRLKCDRDEPCSNCVARGIDCVYAPWPRGRTAAQKRNGPNGTQQLEGRIRHLEQLLGSIVSQMPPRQGEASTPSSQAPQSTGYEPPQNGAHQVKPGRMMSSDTEMVYVSGSHWAAICNEVDGIREHLDRDDRAHHGDETGQIRGRAPFLLEGVGTMSTVDDILSDIPPKDVADRLVSRYLNCTDPSIVILHKPTFEQEYKRMWLDPKGVSTPWLALLFGVLSQGAFLYMRSQEELPGAMGNHRDAMVAFQRRASECLLISNYSTSPGTYTMEALLFNIGGEFARCRDAHLGLWVLSSIVIRLAMRMGYHRDPEKYPEISPFQGEMRRRVWAVVMQLDTLGSGQLGLPTMIQEPQCDTRLPLNLLDEDFGPDSTQLPPARPETQLTPVLYTITKAKAMAIFRTIFNHVSLGRIEAYEEVMALDRRVNDIRQSIPPCFRIANLEDSITVPPYILIRRYNLEFLFQKSRCILHRHHMALSYQDAKYHYSRSCCVEAAMSILEHQASIFKEVQVGGLLFRERWFISSLERHDFLLAAMIVWLELSSRPHQQPCSPEQLGQDTALKFSREAMVQALHKSRLFWNEFQASSAEARQAFDMLSAMLDKVSISSEAQENQHAQFHGEMGNFTPSVGGYLSDQGLSTNTTDATRDGTLLYPTTYTIPQPASSFGGQSQSDPSGLSQTTFSPNIQDIGAMLNSPDIIDWDLWDTFVQTSHPTE